MARILEKTVESVESLLSPFSTSYGFQSLMQKCISVKTKKEEKAIITECLNLVKSKLGEPSPSNRSLVNCLSFVVFADLLGYKAPFAHIHAVKLASSSSVLQKKLGYLFCSYLLGSSHELTLLMVNTMVRDLALQTSVGATYDNCHDPIAIAAALSASCYLTPLDSVSTILPLAVDKLHHPSPYVRGKAVSSLQHLALQINGSRFFNSPEHLSSFLLGRLSTVVHKLLTDPNPAVLAIGLEFLQFLAPQKANHTALCGDIEDSGGTLREEEEDVCQSALACGGGNEGNVSQEDNILNGLAPALVHIQKQILGGKMPEDYVFHSVPAPWMQMSILKLFRFLRKEEIAENGIPALLMETFRAANRRVLIGWAIIIECVQTAVEIDLPEPLFEEIVSVLGKLVIEGGTGKESLPKWLSSNLLYTSLSLLLCLGRKNVAALDFVMTSHDVQDGLRGSIHHSDPSIRRLAIGLITSCGGLSSHEGNRWSAEKICLLLLEECSPKKSDLGFSPVTQPICQWKKECLERIVSITSASSFSESEGPSWQLAVLLRSLPLAPDRQTAILIRDRIQRFLLPSRGDWEDLGSDSVPRCKVLRLLEKHCQSKCASTYLLELYVWVYSEFHHLLPETTHTQAIQQLIHLGQKVIFNNKKGNISAIVEVLFSIVQALSHIILKNSPLDSPEGSTENGIIESIQCFLVSVEELDTTPRLMNACRELFRVLPYAHDVSKALPKGSSMPDVSKMDLTLSFLDEYVCGRLEECESVGESPSSVPFQPFPPDQYNAELAISVRRQLSLGLPLHCHPWQVSRDASEIKGDDDDDYNLDLSGSMSLANLPSSHVASSHEASLPDEFLSLSLESQLREAEIFDDKEKLVPWGDTKQSSSNIWTSAGRANLDGSSVVSSSRPPFARESTLNQKMQHLDRSQQDLMMLLLLPGNSGIVLNPGQTPPESSDPLDVLINDGLQIGDIPS